MKKRPARKPSRRRSSRKAHVTVTRYSFILLGSLLLLVTAGLALKSTRGPVVLGANTSSLLARGGDDSGSSSGGDDHGSGSGGSSSGSSSSGGDHGGSSSGGSTSGSSGSSGGSGGGSVSNDSLVDCVGPDGKHFTTTFKACDDLNRAYSHSTVFTQIQSQARTSTQNVRTEVKNENGKQEVKIETKTAFGTKERLEIKSANGKTRVKIETKNTDLELVPLKDKVSLRAKHEDGTETELEAHDALEKLNRELEAEDVEIGTTSARGVVIRKGEVEAETHFPLSVDLATGALIVTTPAGTKTVAILPDQAIKNLLATGVLSSVENEATAGGTIQKATLTEANGEPSFAVKGIKNKKFLGLIPVSYAKTAYVSAQSGRTVKTDESLLNRALETLSF